MSFGLVSSQGSESRSPRHYAKTINGINGIPLKESKRQIKPTNKRLLLINDVQYVDTLRKNIALSFSNLTCHTLKTKYIIHVLFYWLLLPLHSTSYLLYWYSFLEIAVHRIADIQFEIHLVELRIMLTRVCGSHWKYRIWNEIDEANESRRQREWELKINEERAKERSTESEWERRRERMIVAISNNVGF